MKHVISLSSDNLIHVYIPTLASMKQEGRNEEENGNFSVCSAQIIFGKSFEMGGKKYKQGWMN